jgi:hypothetical protein
MNKNLIESFSGNIDGQPVQASIYQTDQTYSITYNINGNEIKNEDFAGKSLYYVEDAARNWLAGIKKLNG